MKRLFVPRIIAALMIVLTALPAWADARHTVLMDVLKINELSAILHEEGLEFGATLNREWLEEKGGPAWSGQVVRIYDTLRISEGIRAGLEPAFEGDELEQAISFFASDLGSKIVSLENSARAAMGDPLIEEEARARFAQVQEGDDPKLAQIERMIEAGDLLNRNVTSTLNANYQFLRALVDGDVYVMSDEEILSDVQAEREAITADTLNWLGGFMTLAYSPLSVDELTTYADFASSPAGKALNSGFFAGFDPLYEDISYALGRAMAFNMAAEEL
ncbi:DUF2059 domain-containing protein [Sulfitobacter guttiformis]|uniref:Uncharacterized protein DUF2059 n=1 Tax=Sulfitobacter guttiformis TaxID=74349 RepID=A0A420DHU9_9RHOB|nr:DUF2059 domain-containing protein [Sulfitobacter guttiformis]KIN72444.1 DUF2059 domain containing protein [Sulfitobacter guttiformis KCTC 32187]RKE93803.1 uncharacterized protein DUF2059 [Sulfitobacter guttiformis]